MWGWFLTINSLIASIGGCKHFPLYLPGYMTEFLHSFKTMCNKHLTGDKRVTQSPSPQRTKGKILMKKQLTVLTQVHNSVATGPICKQLSK